MSFYLSVPPPGIPNLPYPLSKALDGYIFVTDKGIEYLIGIDWDRDILPNTSFSDDLVVFSVLPKSSEVQALEFDPRIQLTIRYAIESLFSDRPTAVLFYACSTVDQKDEVRHRLFRRWFTMYSSSQYKRLDFDYTDNRTYMTVIYKYDHPNADIRAVIKQAVENVK